MAVEQRPFPGQERTPVSLTGARFTRSGNNCNRDECFCWSAGVSPAAGGRKESIRIILTRVCAPACCGWDSRAPFKPRAIPATHQLVSTNSLNEPSGMTESAQSVSLTERGCLTRGGWREENRFRIISTLICLPTYCGWDSRAPFQRRVTPQRTNRPAQIP